MIQGVKMILFGFLFWAVAFLPYITFSLSTISFKTARHAADFEKLTDYGAHKTEEQVLASDWLTLTEEDWSAIGPSQMSYSIRVPELVHESYAKGTVLVYRKSDVTEPLPFVSPQLKIEHNTAVDLLWIEASYKKRQKMDTPIASYFRYLLIPKGKMESKELSQRKIKRMGYAEVMALFGLEG